MFVQELYIHKISKAKALREQAELSQDIFAKDSLRRNASSIEIDATYLAHCIAKFGNFQVSECEIKKFQAAIQDCTGEAEKFWRNGLALLIRHLKATH